MFAWLPHLPKGVAVAHAFLSSDFAIQPQVSLAGCQPEGVVNRAFFAFQLLGKYFFA